MKKLVFLLLVALIISPIYSQENIGISGFSWGTKDAQIRNSLGRFNENEKEGGLVIYTYWNKKTYSYNADLSFIFINNELVGGAYDINSCHRIRPGKYDSNYYINAYSDLKHKLTNEYGTPIASNDFPKVYLELPSNAPQRTKDLILKSKMPYYTVWNLDDGTAVTLVFDYDSDWTLLYSYASKRLLESSEM